MRRPTLKLAIWESAWPLLRQIVATYQTIGRAEHQEGGGKIHVNQELKALQEIDDMARSSSKNAFCDVSICLKRIANGVETDV